MAALAAYAALAALAWSTMDSTWFETRFGKIQPRLLTLVILALLAFRTVLHAIRMNREAEAEAIGEQQSQNSERIEPIAESRVPTATKSRE